MNKLKDFEEKYLKKDIPKFNVGDTVHVYVKIKEEEKTRTQVFDGTVIKKKGTGVRATFMVRRISYGEGVERTFLVHSPFIDKVVVKKKGSVRRAKLYYLRNKKGKKSKVAQKVETQPRAEGA
ncbi:MAG: 50S ribosomal protein L19 [Candidatus Omnitrophica bacterium]|nr:50S ribosomal protein L19 [Candidatus Omnitrophota bacterium]